ncbi:MAG: hypothetical protein K1X88_16515 [Nannocystaceae bacterium]|nr:hypothetical protein [Nannocystaceae bacterium]
MLRPLRLLLAIALALPLAWQGVGCLGRACTAIGCLDMFTFSLVPSGARIEDGSYRLQWTADGEPSECAFEVASGDRCPSWARQMCVIDSSCAGVGRDGAIDLTLDDLPEHVTFTLLRDQSVLAQGEDDPDYDASRPNGEQCEPECTQGRVAIAVP